MKILNLENLEINQIIILLTINKIKIINNNKNIKIMKMLIATIVIR